MIDLDAIDYPKAKWAKRVWSKVDKRGPDECWPWLGRAELKGGGRAELKGGGRARKGKGRSRGKLTPYGMLGMWYPREKRIQRVRVNRLIYWLMYGNLQSGAIVRHLCSNSLCCNPKHLAKGTHQDNMDDMVRAGRSTRGERSKQAKLIWSKVREMRRLYAGGGWTHKLLAHRYGVGCGIAGRILRDEDWCEHQALPEPSDSAQMLLQLG